jgi:hypothetical protein
MNTTFVDALEKEAFELETGEPEVLLSRFLADTNVASEGNFENNSEETPREILIRWLSGSMTATELDQLILANPSHVISIRGDIISFFEKSSSIPAYFMPDDFIGASASIAATSNGSDTIIMLNELLQIPIAVVQRSERYDGNGNNLTTIDIDTPLGPWGPGINPVQDVCQNELNILKYFTAQVVNGGVLLTYDITQIESSGSGLRITISRLDPGSTDF